MRKFYLIKQYIGALLLIASGTFSAAQCPAGYATASLNWDNLDYLSQTGTYATFVSTAMMQTQKFTLGVNRLSINFPSTITTQGENITNTAEAGSYGTGADVEYSGNGAITITFDAAVYNLQFSLYDIDASQTVRVTATDAAAAALVVNMTAVTTGVVTVTGSGGTTPLGTASSTALANTDTRGSVNISIAGNLPAGTAGVKKVVITLAGTAGNFWLSDLSACVTGSFPTNYYASQKPWQGQPAYYLVTPDNNSVYMMNPLTGVAQWMFSEASSPWVNSLAYDPIHHVAYYVMDHASPVSTNKSLKKYDFNTETSSTVIADLTTMGIPLFDMVVESAGAAYYNGSLFLGVEGTNSTKTSNRKSIIWRIDFDAAQNPIQAAEVFAQLTDNGSGTLMHDWGDFIIKDGMLYDFNTGNQTTTAQFIHFNMQSASTTIFNTNGNPAPIQAGQTWDGTLYWTGGQGSETGKIAKYLENGTIGAKVNATVTACSPAWVGRAGDASDPFKPKSDFGDAPDSYDPVPDDKATNEYDCNLRLGASFDREWDKTPSAAANADGSDEDGITTVTVLSPGAVNYVTPVSVYNNTGAPATLTAWLDYNGNGVFDASEAKTVTIATNASMQSVILAWSGIAVSLPIGSTTYLRLRITSASNGMTASDATGWYANGETEDYAVPVDAMLPIRMLSFAAAPDGINTVSLDWSTGKEINLAGFDIERSLDGNYWNKIGFVAGSAASDLVNTYHFDDRNPVAGKIFYRLKLQYTDGRTEYSDTRSIEWKFMNSWVKISPNPVHGQAQLRFSVEEAGQVSMQVTSASGALVLNKNLTANKGLNQVVMNDFLRMAPGMYLVQLGTVNGSLTTKIFVE